MATAALRGEWCNEDLVLRFEGVDQLTICTCNDATGVVETAFKYTVDKKTLVCKSGENVVRSFTMQAAEEGILKLVDEADATGAVIELHQTYDDAEGDGGEMAHDTSGTDLGMDFCVVGKKITK